MVASMRSTESNKQATVDKARNHKNRYENKHFGSDLQLVSVHRTWQLIKNPLSAGYP